MIRMARALRPSNCLWGSVCNTRHSTSNGADAGTHGEPPFADPRWKIFAILIEAPRAGWPYTADISWEYRCFTTGACISSNR